ncbi:MAG: PH domain-containing protein, partial [Anaerolineae bacterium]
MNEVPADNGYFPPPRQRGLLIHGLLIAGLAALSLWAGLNLIRASVGPAFLAYLLCTALAVLPLPFLGYRLYALLRSGYTLERERLILRWGLRIEEIPLSDIEWIRPASDLEHPLSLPWLRLPGGLLGLRRHVDLGQVEFLAAEPHNLLLVGTTRRVYVISPAEARRFVQAFARAIELGSLVHAEARSQYPTFIISQAWENLMARYLWVSGALLNAGLFIWVTLLIPTLGQITLGAQFGPEVAQTVPATQLILLPMVSILLFLIGWGAGLNFYR